MRRLLILPLLLGVSSPAMAGVPEKFEGKWMKAIEDHRRSFMIDTEDVEVRGDKLRFNVKREIAPGVSPDPNILETWEGQVKINCKKFSFFS